MVCEPSLPSSRAIPQKVYDEMPNFLKNSTLCNIRKMRSVQVLPIVVGISLCGAALIYKWYRTRSSSKDAVDGKKEKRRPKLDKVEMIIENEFVPLVLGRNENSVKSIEERHRVTITFNDKHDGNHMCQISGHYNNVMEAAKIIGDVVKKSKNTTEEIIIPKQAYQRISSTFTEICRETTTKISSNRDGMTNNLCRLVITGAYLNVRKAKQMVEDRVRQDTVERENEIQREPRFNQRNSPDNSSMENLSQSSPQPSPSAGILSNAENFSRLPNNFGGQMEVYVSAVASPARFWVQIVSPQIKKLDALIQEMTDYYSQAENKEKHRIKDAYLGQIVAAMFQYDNKWYRAEIVAILPNEYDPRKVVLDLYFLDFGDSIYVDTQDVFEVRTDFLTLRYQAVECFLANVQPVHPLEGGQWNHNAINRFEEITHVAKWKKLIAKTVKTRERYRGIETSTTESSTIPGLELYDNIDDHEVNLASIMILENFAVPANQDDAPSPLSRYSSSESVLRLDGSNSSGSVAEKTMMFELTANMQSSRLSPKPRSNDGHMSPTRHSPSPRPNHRNDSPKQKEKNDSANHSTVNGSDEKQTNFQDMLSQQMMANRNWGDIMDAES